MQVPCHWVLGSFPVPHPGMRLFYSYFPLAAVTCHRFPEGGDVCCPFPTNRFLFLGETREKPLAGVSCSLPCDSCPHPWGLHCMDTFLRLFMIFLQVPSEVPGERSCKRVKTPLLLERPRVFGSCPLALAVTILLVFFLPLSTYTYSSK